MDAAEPIRLPHECLVLLVGPSGSGKSHWANATFAPHYVVSSDRMRAVVGEGEQDQRASKDAFDVVDVVLDRRLRRRLFTVIDSLGLDGKQRARHKAIADKHDVPCIVIAFDTPADLCRKQNRKRDGRQVPAPVVNRQLAGWPVVLALLEHEGFTAVHTVGAGSAPVRIVPAGWERAHLSAKRQQEDPVALRFGLQLPRFTFPGGPPTLGADLAAIAQTAEDVGFESLWVMDHFLQIPMVGREWDDMLESYTTLSYLAGHTTKATLGTLVTGVTYRNIGHLGKIIATLDVLSGGRAVCGIGAAWFDREHKAYGWEFPPVRERFELLEDALQALPMLWGPGAPPFDGKRVSMKETVCYPRPLQDKVPILIGGGGEKKTLRLVAKYADACNLFGDAATVRHKVEVLHRHCADVGRDPSEIEVTHLGSVTLDENPPASPRPVAMMNIGTVEDQIGRLRDLADAGVQHAIVNLPTMTGASDVERCAPIVSAFPS